MILQMKRWPGYLCLGPIRRPETWVGVCCGFPQASDSLSSVPLTLVSSLCPVFCHDSSVVFLCLLLMKFSLSISLSLQLSLSFSPCVLVLKVLEELSCVRQTAGCNSPGLLYVLLRQVLRIYDPLTLPDYTSSYPPLLRQKERRVRERESYVERGRWGDQIEMLLLCTSLQCWGEQMEVVLPWETWCVCMRA